MHIAGALAMFNSVFARLGGSGAWKQAPIDIAELPQPVDGDWNMISQLLLTAGGLALVLSRCAPKEVEREYPNATELYCRLRNDLKRASRTYASAELMLETLREVSERLDPISRQSLRACLEARRDHACRVEARSRPLLDSRSLATARHAAADPAQPRVDQCEGASSRAIFLRRPSTRSLKRMPRIPKGS